MPIPNSLRPRGVWRGRCELNGAFEVLKVHSHGVVHHAQHLVAREVDPNSETAALPPRSSASSAARLSKYDCEYCCRPVRRWRSTPCTGSACMSARSGYSSEVRRSGTERFSSSSVVVEQRARDGRRPSADSARRDLRTPQPSAAGSGSTNASRSAVRRTRAYWLPIRIASGRLSGKRRSTGTSTATPNVSSSRDVKSTREQHQAAATDAPP